MQPMHQMEMPVSDMPTAEDRVVAVRSVAPPHCTECRKRGTFAGSGSKTATAREGRRAGTPGKAATCLWTWSSVHLFLCVFVCPACLFGVHVCLLACLLACLLDCFFVRLIVCLLVFPDCRSFVRSFVSLYVCLRERERESVCVCGVSVLVCIYATLPDPRDMLCFSLHRGY